MAVDKKLEDVLCTLDELDKDKVYLIQIKINFDEYGPDEVRDRLMNITKIMNDAGINCVVSVYNDNNYNYIAVEEEKCQ